MLKSSDKLLQGMKQKIDSLLAQDKKLQKFLGWVEEKSSSVQTKYKSFEVRSFYFHHSLYLNIGNSLFRGFYRSVEMEPLSHINSLDIYPYFVVCDDYDYDFRINSEIDPTLVQDFDLACNLYPIFHYDRQIYCHNLDELWSSDFGLYLVSYSSESEEEHVLGELAWLHHSDSQKALQAIKEQILDISVEFDSPLKTQDNFKAWWESIGQKSKEHLREQVIKHRNIGHDWQFSKDHKEMLRQYLYAAKLLVDCLNSGCKVSKEVREEIEFTLLLPLA
jgi:hypothetical protein